MRILKYLIAFYFLWIHVVVSLDITPEKVQTQIQSYVRQRASTLRVMRGGTFNIKCYDKYIPDITKLANEGKTESQKCIDLAESQKEDALEKLKNKRAELAERITGIQDLLNSCTQKTDVIEYLKCLQANADINKNRISEVESISNELLTKLSKTFDTIEIAGNVCIRLSLERIKQKTDDIFTALQNCLINGEESEEGAGNQAPPEEGGDEPSSQGGGGEPPSQGAGDEPPSQGGGDEPPSQGDRDEPPSQGDGDEPSSQGGGGEPPSQGAGDEPPSQGGGDEPPSQGDGDEPPSQGDGDEPSSQKGGDEPPSQGDGDEPPSQGDGDEPPFQG